MSNIENDYRNLMSDVRMNAQTKTRIKQAASQRLAERPDANARETSPSASRRGIPRRSFVKFGIAAAVGALGIGIAAPSVLTMGAGEKTPAASVAPSNSFGLLAYASEPNAAPNQVKDLSVEYFSSAHDERGGISTLDGGDVAGRGWTFDLSCTGENIVSVTYSMGDEPHDEESIETGEWSGFYEETQIFEGEQRFGAESEWLTSITIPYESEGRLGSSEDADPSFHRALVVWTHISEETRAYGEEYRRSFDELYYSDHDTLDRLLCEFDVRETYEVALKLAETPLVVTARFSDGATQTKRYRIAPKDDYVEKMIAQGVHFDDAGMYTIVEIA